MIMDKPEHNEENIQRLATTVVGFMDLNDLIELATDRQIEIFEQDKEIFEKDWDYFDRINKAKDAQKTIF